MSADNPWLPSGYAQKPDGTTQLLCFPHAGGGSAIFYRWAKSLPRHVGVVPVKLPGRESRFNEPAFDNLNTLISAMVPNLLAAVQGPFALYGHSMGGLIAYELAQYLREHHQVVPSCFFVSACRSPDRFQKPRSLHRLPDEEMIQSLITDYNEDGKVSDAELEIMRVMVDTIRADLKLLETYEFQSREPLPCPLVALAATRDRGVSATDVNGWRAFTSGKFTMRTIPGHHFFLRDQETAVTDLVASKL